MIDKNLLCDTVTLFNIVCVDSVNIPCVVVLRDVRAVERGGFRSDFIEDAKAGECTLTVDMAVSRGFGEDGGAKAYVPPDEWLGLGETSREWFWTVGSGGFECFCLGDISGECAGLGLRELKERFKLYTVREFRAVRGVGGGLHHISVIGKL